MSSPVVLSLTRLEAESIYKALAYTLFASTLDEALMVFGDRQTVTAAGRAASKLHRASTTKVPARLPGPIRVGVRR